MDYLQLFHVTVTQTWRAEGDALVLAEDRYEAERMAMREVDLDHLDADDEEKDATVQPVGWEVLQALDKKKSAEMWLILPDAGRFGQGRSPRTVELQEFLEVLSPERAEALRIAAIERNNGQLALPLPETVEAA